MLLNKVHLRNLFYGTLVVLLMACGKTPLAPSGPLVSCPESTSVLNVIMDGATHYLIATDGNVYLDADGKCKLVQAYFKPGFEKDNYTHDGEVIFIKTPEGLFPTRNEYLETFEKYGDFRDMFLRSINDTNRYWNALTLQSPQAQTIPEYVALRTCLLNATCTFRDNRFDLVPDPTGEINRVLKFTAVAPSGGMVTSKSSLESTIAYFGSGDDFWCQARYFFTDSFPYSIADFESQWFDLSPGPRIIFDNGSLAIENKFGLKQKYRQADPSPVPKNKWVTIKVHFKYHQTSGTTELWQDGQSILSVTVPNLPLSNAIQTNIEFGITATDQACTLYIDDIRVSKSSF